jgi:hypothetical protein
MVVLFLVALPLVAGCVGPYPGAYGGYGGGYGYGGYGGTPYGGSAGAIPVPVPVPDGSSGAVYGSSGYGGYGYGQPYYGYAPNGQVKYDYNHNGVVDAQDMWTWHQRWLRRHGQTTTDPNNQAGNQTPTTGTNPTNDPTTGNTGTQPTNGSNTLTAGGKPHPNNGGQRWPFNNPTLQPGKSGAGSTQANDPRRLRQLNVPPQARQQLRAQAMPQVASRAGLRAPMAPNMGAARPSAAMPRVAPRAAAPAVSRQAPVRKPGL